MAWKRSQFSRRKRQSTMSHQRIGWFQCLSSRHVCCAGSRERKGDQQAEILDSAWRDAWCLIFYHRRMVRCDTIKMLLALCHLLRLLRVKADNHYVGGAISHLRPICQHNNDAVQMRPGCTRNHSGKLCLMHNMDSSQECKIETVCIDRGIAGSSRSWVRMRRNNKEAVRHEF